MILNAYTNAQIIYLQKKIITISYFYIILNIRMKKLFLLFCLPLFTEAQIISTVAGTGISGYSGDGGPATDAKLYFPSNIAFDSSDNLFIVDELNNVIRMVDSSGIITTMVGNGYGAGLSFGGYMGDGGPATAAELYDPNDIAFDGAGNLFIADHWNNVIRKVSTSGIITTFAGNGIAGYVGDGGSATAAEFSGPTGLALDGLENLIIADQHNNVLRKVNLSGIITTIAGSGLAGYSGDGGHATAARFQYPTSIAVDHHGSLFISDQSNNRFRKVDSAGIITTVAGNGISGYTGDGWPATNARINNATGIEVDSSGNLFLGDQENNVIRMVNSLGIISTLVGDGIAGYSGDGGVDTSCKMHFPWGARFDHHGNLFIADYYNHVIRKVTFVGHPDTAGSLTNKLLSASSNRIQIYPNPVTNALIIVSDNAISQITISNLLGQIIYSNQYYSEKTQVDVSGQPKGVYLVRINGTEVSKFVKQ